MTSLTAMVGVILLTCMSTGQRAGADQTLLSEDFESDPTQRGWLIQAPPQGKAIASWTGDALLSGRRCITAVQGQWESPLIPVEPFQYYRLQFRSIAQGDGYWAAIFFDRDGRALSADHYSGLYASDDWLDNEFCFRAKVNATHARVRFQPRNDKAVYVDDVTVSVTERQAVAEWADALYQTLPPLNLLPASGRWRHLPRTIQALRAGRRLRIVMLGDSIINDIGNSPFDVLVERMYPGARLQVITSVEGGKGCKFYSQENRVKQYVLDFKPDLLILGGISHGADVEAVRSVIHQVRAQSAPEILVMTGCIAPRELVNEGLLKSALKSGARPIRTEAEYGHRLKLMAQEEKVEFLDMRVAWDRYILTCGKPYEWFLRDPVHANARGRQVVARILEHYFAPN